MPIELSNEIFENKLFVSTLTKINDSPMGAKDAYWVNRVLNKIQEFSKDYLTAKDKIIKQFSSKEQPEGLENGQIQLDPLRIEEAQKELSELFTIKIEIPFEKRPFPTKLELSPAEIGAVVELFDMSSLED